MAETNKKTRILIVEDDLILQKALIDKFNTNNFEVFKAGDGPTAVETALKEKPDIILLDIIIPRFSGVEVLKKLRDDDWGKDVPVILLTNIDPSDETVNDIVKYNPSYYLLKTTKDFDDVVGKVKEKLGLE